MAFGNLSAARDSQPKCLSGDDSDYTYYIVKSGTTIYKGSLVCIEYTGGAITGYVVYASNTASELFAGVAAETVVGDGTKKIKVWRRGLHEFTKGTAAITDVGIEFYCDGGASGTPGIIQSGTSTGPKVGRAVMTNSTTGLWISIRNYCP